MYCSVPLSSLCFFHFPSPYMCRDVNTTLTVPVTFGQTTVNSLGQRLCVCMCLCIYVTGTMESWPASGTLGATIIQIICNKQQQQLPQGTCRIPCRCREVIQHARAFVSLSPTGLKRVQRTSKGAEIATARHPHCRMCVLWLGSGNVIKLLLWSCLLISPPPIPLAVHGVATVQTDVGPKHASVNHLSTEMNSRECLPTITDLVKRSG